MPNFRTFHRNCDKCAKGGVAILVRENRACDCIQIWSGQGEQETLAVMFPTVEPKLVVMTKKYHFCLLFACTIAILHPKFEKVIKTTQNVPKTVGNH